MARLIIEKEFGKVVVYPTPKGLMARINDVEDYVTRATIKHNGQKKVALRCGKRLAEEVQKLMNRQISGDVYITVEATSVLYELEQQMHEMAERIARHNFFNRETFFVVYDNGKVFLRLDDRLLGTAWENLWENLKEVKMTERAIAKWWSTIEAALFRTNMTSDLWEGRKFITGFVRGDLIRKITAKEEASIRYEIEETERRRNEAIKEARQTGRDVVINEMMVECDGSVDDCSADIIQEVASKYGKVYLNRIHTH